MFDSEQTDAFRSISAPMELKEKVLALEQKKPHNNRRIILSISSAAACLLLVAAIPLLSRLPQKNPAFTVNGTAIGSDALLLNENNSGIMAASARTVQKYMAEISAEFPENTVITVSDGSLELTDTDTNEFISSGAECTAKGNITIRWIVDLPTENTQYYLTTDTDGKKMTFEMYYESASGAWYIMQTTDK